MNSKMGTTLIKWPSREAIQQTMPFCFRVHYGFRVTPIIDCFELILKNHVICLQKLACGPNINTTTLQSM